MPLPLPATTHLTPTQFKELTDTIKPSTGWAVQFVEALSEWFFPGALSDPEVEPASIPLQSIKVPKAAMIAWMQDMVNKTPQFRTENMMFLLNVGPGVYDEATLN